EEEFINVLTRSRFTAYTEFGCCGGASPEYVKKYIMDEKDYLDCSPENPIWVSHHAFNAWSPTSWLRIPENEYYFGGYESVDELLELSLKVQRISYQSVFEEIRKQWPHCSMAINWDFNEPWPCAAGNSLVNWPAEPKPALEGVRAALRPRIASIRTGRNRYLTGECVEGEIWVLNDTAEASKPCKISVYAETGGERILISTVSAGEVAARSNGMSGRFSFKVKADVQRFFKIILDVENSPEMNSEYTFIHKKAEQ
ncbi:MAG: hypothetical protein IJX92_08200, partial [Clostridia bacterium]|nr:hypothetical protein [Clostridia bacterium]